MDNYSDLFSQHEPDLLLRELNGNILWYWKPMSPDDKRMGCVSNAPFEAADEIEQLRAEIAALQAECEGVDAIGELVDEIERLRSALERIAQHDMQAIALDALRLNPVRTRPTKEESDGSN